MRTRKALINTICGLVYELITLICGLITPRLILSTFGSSYNGIVNSISQFISCIVLMRAGVDSVTKVALYKPLAQNDYLQISKVIQAAEKFLHKINYLYIAIVLVFAVVYPFAIDEFEWLFSFSLVLILAVNALVENYFGVAAQIILSADQRYYIVFLVKSISVIANTLISYVLIKLQFGIHAVKFGSAFAFSITPVLFYIYTRHKYNIDKNVVADDSVLTQRWDAVAHQIAHFVTENASIIILTFFAPLTEISVYSVYTLVTRNITKLLKSATAGIGDAFGNMMAKNEEQLLRKNFAVFELLIFTLATVFFVTTGLTIVPFIKVYTSGVHDTEYSRPVFGAILVLASFFSCIRIPYQNIADAAGHFKQTKYGAMFESVLNIVVSITLVSKVGLVGVAVGSMTAAVFRTIQYSIYLSHNILKRNFAGVLWHILSSVMVLLCTSISYRAISANVMVIGYLSWAIEASKVFLLASVFSCLKIIVFYRNTGMILLKKLTKTIIKDQ